MPWAILVVAFGSAGVVSASVDNAGFPFVIGTIVVCASLVVLIVWLVRKGDEGPNKYGPDPRQSTSRQP
jgi:uncharacterized membrane protein YhaH (DUF805 family)